MKIKIKFLNATVLLTFIFTFYSCFDKPDPFVSPNWDVDLLIPVTNKKFELIEIMEKDSSFLFSSSNPEMLGLLYFHDTQKFKSFKTDNNIKINAFTYSYSQTLGPLRINLPIPIYTGIRVEEWTDDVVSGTEQVFPEQEGHVVIGIQGLATAKSATLDEGNLRFAIVNNLPVEIVLRGIQLRNAGDKSIIVEKPNSISNWVTIPPFQSDLVIFDVSGKTVEDSIEFVGTIYSIGSGFDKVYVPAEAGTLILAAFTDLVVSSATANLPEQKINFSQSIQFDDSTMIESAVIDSGSIKLTINNNFDLKINSVLTFKNLFDQYNQPYSLHLSLSRNEQNRIIEVPNLHGWRISSLTSGVPTNYFDYSVSMNSDSTGEVSTVSKDDSISIKLEFDHIVLGSLTGKIKPTYVNLKESGIKLNYGEVNQKYSFGKLNFKEAKTEVLINSSADLNLLLNGQLTASNYITQATLNLESIHLPSSTPIKIDVTNLMNSFTTKIPDSFSIGGSSIINPNYELGSISKNDSIFGSVSFEFPLDLGISAGSMKDTIELNLDINDEDIERFNYGEITIDLFNSVPIEIKFSAIALDSNLKEIIYLPPSYNEFDKIIVPAPTIDNEGNVLLTAEHTQTIKLLGEDIQKFLNSSFLAILIEFETSGENSVPVKFKTTQSFSFSMRAKVGYKAEL